MQIIANLVGNALKFTERGSITVRVRAAGRRTRGRSSSPTPASESRVEEQATIFEEFRQGEAVEHRGRGGTGLGLAIVKKIAAVLGGTVEIQSAAGEGSRFTVVLPRDLPQDDEASATAAETAEWPAPVPQAGRSVLIVDDDEGVRRLFAYELEPLGVRILEAGDGRTAVEMATAERPDAILLDVLMPRVDGWETLRLLKQRPETRNIPVVILSVVDNRAFGLSLGAFDYLVKPVETSALFDSLSRAGVLATRGHLLVVDDDADVRNLLAQELVSRRLPGAERGGRSRGARRDVEGAAERGAARPHDAAARRLRGPLPDARGRGASRHPGRHRHREGPLRAGPRGPARRGAARDPTRRRIRRGSSPRSCRPSRKRRRRERSHPRRRGLARHPGPHPHAAGGRGPRSHHRVRRTRGRRGRKARAARPGADGPFASGPVGLGGDPGDQGGSGHRVDSGRGRHRARHARRPGARAGRRLRRFHPEADRRRDLRGARGVAPATPGERGVVSDPGRRGAPASSPHGFRRARPHPRRGRSRGGRRDHPARPRKRRTPGGRGAHPRAGVRAGSRRRPLRPRHRRRDAGAGLRVRPRGRAGVPLRRVPAGSPGHRRRDRPRKGVRGRGGRLHRQAARSGGARARAPAP